MEGNGLVGTLEVPQFNDYAEESSAVKFFKQLKQRFVKSDKAEIITLLHKLVSMRYNDLWKIKEYILEVSYMVSKLITLYLEFPDEVVVYFALMPQSPQVSYFEVSYNYQKEKWIVNELISHLMQEE